MTVIDLPFPVSINAMFADGRSRRIKSQRYCDWLLEAGAEIMRQRPVKCPGPVVLFFEFKMPDARKRDITNLLKGPEDLLVKHGIIEGDDSSVVRGVHASWSEAVDGCRVTVERVG